MTSDAMTTDRLFTRSFVCLSLANFMLFFGFYSLMTILPFYMADVLNAPQSLVGLALSALTVTSVAVRPVSGYVYDIMRRKPLYVAAYLVFVLACAGYVWATAIAFIIGLRLVQGLAFGTATVGGYAIVADLLPPRRMGEGIGYYGLANTLAMCLSPMTTLLLHRYCSFNVVLGMATGVSALGLLCALAVVTPLQSINRNRRFSLDNLVVKRGLVPALCFLLTAIPYGMTTGYMALYARDLGFSAEAGFFFTAMAIGLGAARTLGGRLIDRLSPSRLITWSTAGCVVCFAAVSSLRYLAGGNHMVLVAAFMTCALVVGVAYGNLHPAYNKLLLSLTTPEHRAAASSTYLTGFDLGIGLGFVIGGAMATAMGSYGEGYLAGAATSLLALAVFAMWQHCHAKGGGA